jgi:hypothetical protein
MLQNAARTHHISTLSDRADALVRLNRYQEALAAFELVRAQEPNHLHALNESGALQVQLGRPEAALAYYDRALAIAPNVVELHINRGTALRALNRFDSALASFAAAAAIDSGRAEAHYNASLVRLCLGEFKAGWKGYEWRWRKADWVEKRRQFIAPLWLGNEPIAGKTMLLCAEQGFGDTIQFARYASLAAAHGAKVVLAVQPALKALLASVPGVAQVVGDGEALPGFDLYCPLLSLPSAFETELATIPANVPYIRPFEERVTKWRERLPQNGRLHVGICWAGNSVHLNDRQRSIALERFAKLLSVSGVDYISLQKEVSATEATILREHSVNQLGQEFQDFSDTAAVISMLDLIITVDTSIAHLAGAMSKAVALLVPFSPDWRWMLDRTDSPWYPTMRLIRQSAIGDWNGPIKRVHQELSAIAARRASAQFEAQSARL